MRPTDLPRGFELKYNERKNSSGTGSSVREEACSVPAKSAGSKDKMSVLQRGSVFQQNVTKLAIAPRSIAIQTEDPACGGISLWHWLTPAAVASTATQTTDPAADGRSLHHMALNPGAVLAGTAESAAQLSAHPGAVPGPWTKAESSIPDSHAGADEGTHSQHLSGHAHSEWELRRGWCFPPRRLRGGPRPKRGAELNDRGCSLSNMLAATLSRRTISSADEAAAERKRARFHKGSSPCPSYKSRMPLPITSTFRSHGSSSHRTMHHERVTVHWSVLHSLRLKTDDSHESGQPSSARALLNNLGHCGYAGIRVGEAENPRPATHDRD